MARLNIGFSVPSFQVEGRKVTCKISWYFRDFSEDTLRFLISNDAQFIERGTVSASVTSDDSEGVFNYARGEHLALTKAKNKALKKAYRIFNRACSIAESISKELNEATFYIGKTIEREDLYLSKESGYEVISLYNRYGLSVCLVKTQDGNYMLKGNWQTSTVLYYKGGSQIRVYDPEGGPAICVGGQIPGKDLFVKKIKKTSNGIKVYVG